MGEKAKRAGMGLLFALAALLTAALTLPRLFGLTLYAVTNGSMEPLYPVGAMLYVRAAEPAALEVGESVTFRLPGGGVATHQIRAVDAEEGLLYTQGIANRDEAGEVIPDGEAVPFARVIGVPVACVPGLGALCQWLKRPAGLAVCLGVAAAVLFVVPALPGRAPGGGESGRRESPEKKERLP